jgi:hypothetical protein
MGRRGQFVKPDSRHPLTDHRGLTGIHRKIVEAEAGDLPDAR